MGTKSRKRSIKNKQRNSYIIGATMGILAGIIFGLATQSLVISIIVCGLLGVGLGHAIFKTIN